MIDPLALPGRIVSIVGGGGKTTLLYHLALSNARAGKRVLVTTTTKIYRPREDVFAPGEAQAERLWDQGRFAVIGTPVGEKLAFCPELFAKLSPRADLILLEADGAKHCPVKVPRASEPVILPQCDAVLAVLGLSAIGKPLGQCCFGLAEACALLGVEKDHILTEEDAANILSSPLGSRKDVRHRAYQVILNQADCHSEAGKRIESLLNQQGICAHITAFSPEERQFYQSIARREETHDP